MHSGRLITRSAAIILLAGLALVGCGQKGPLYIPPASTSFIGL